MRVPSQRPSRSNTATSATSSGKRISTTNTASSGKKRKLLSDTSTSKKSASDASTINQNNKRKQPKKQPQQSAAPSKLLKRLTSSKKSQPKKTKVVPLVGVKKIKIKEGKVTVKKILMTTSGAKSQKNLIKTVVKSSKKQLHTKKMTGNPSSSASDSLPASSTMEDRISGASCDMGDQKKVQSKIQPVSKISSKKTKIVKKSKNPSLRSVPAPLTRTKKLEQSQKLKSVKKLGVKRVPITRNIVISQEYSSLHGLAKKKKKIATRKQSSEESKVESNVSQQPDSVADNTESGKSIISVVVQSSDKTSNKKTKDEESAITKIDKKKIVKRKPKIEGKGNTVGIAFTYNEVVEQPTKEKSEMANVTPKRDVKDGATAKCALKKTQKAKIPEAQPTKLKSVKKPQILKSLKVISTKAKKILPSKKSSNLKLNKKLQHSKKKNLKLSDNKPSRRNDQPYDEQNSPKSADNNDADSSTSDEITLDVLLFRQQQMKNENVIHEHHGANSNIPLSPSSSGKLENSEASESKPSLPLVNSVKVESNSSPSASAASSPASINTSDDEDLRSVKNRIKVKLEGSDSDEEENVTRTKSTSKSKSDEDGNRGTIKKESLKQEKAEKRNTVESKHHSNEPSKQTSRKFGMKHPQSGVKRSRGDKNGGSGSDTEQRARRMKLFGFWSGPKRHRVASLNALAKVHCLYENESRGALMGYCGTTATTVRRPAKPKQSASSEVIVASTRTLRSAPGMRGMGKHWDMHNASSTSSSSQSSDDSNSDSPSSPQETPQKQKKKQHKLPASNVSIKKKCKQNMKKVVKRRRNRCELMMDLKDMVVRKRMASLNASAILAASYSVEKRPPKNKDDGAEGVQQAKKKKKKVVSKKILEVEDDSSTSSTDVEVEECDLEQSVIEVRTTPSGGPNSNKKVAVIVNQDTDVTITGVYVNSTTRSTHHEGFCSIAGMQYRISSTSHTQTEATAVATETVLHTSTAAEHPPSVEPPIKSYTPLGALSNMQPPGTAVPPPHHHHHPHPHPHHPPPCSVPPQQAPRPTPGAPISPLGRRHGCTSAFSAPPSAGYGPQPPLHHPPPQGQSDPAYIHGYYQPAGPLISAHHHRHSSSASGGNKVPPAGLSTLEGSPNPTPPPSATSHSGPPTSTPQQVASSSGARSGGDESSDNDVIITATSCSGGGEVAPPPPVPQPLPLQHPHQVSYRYPQSYPPPPTPSTPQHMHHQSYAYNYPHTQYYPSPPASASIQYSNPQHHTHYHNQDLCYSSSANYPPASYFHHKSYSTPPPAPYHRRYIPPPPQYYSSDLYPSASQQSSSQSQQNQQMVVTGSTAGSASSYQPPAAPPPPPPPPPLVDTYPPPVSIVDPYPPPPGYYTGYSAGPGAAGCYSHSPPTRSLAFIDAAYQSCPCPMQSCPKNVHTGPLTGEGKGPQQQQQLPLPPVALALPLEPPGAVGPPSPARGSAGMPPPPSPATASARNPNHTEAFQQQSWSPSTANPPSDVELKNKQEGSQELQTNDFKTETTAIDEVGKTDITRHSLLAISKVSVPDGLCRTKSKKASPPANNVPLLMCDHEFQKKRQRSSDAALELDKAAVLDPKNIKNSVKLEVCTTEKEENLPDAGTVFRNMYQKRKLNSEKNKICEIETDSSVPKKCKLSDLSDKISVENEEHQKRNGMCVEQDSLKSQVVCKTAQKPQALFANGCNVHNMKHPASKRKLEEPLSHLIKRKSVGIKGIQNKIYPSRVKNVSSMEVLDRTNSQVMAKKTVGSNDHAHQKKGAKINGVIPSQKKPSLRHQNSKGQQSVHVENKKIRQCKKSDSSARNKSKVTHMLRSYGSRDSDHSLSDDAEPNRRKVKVSCPPVRRASVGSRKEPCRRNSTVSKNDTTPHPALKKQAPQHQDLAAVTMRKASLKKSLQLPKWSNGWKFEGEPVESKVFLSSDDLLVPRKCYPRMRHQEGDVICPRDCILLKSGPRKTDLPFVAKVAALWENPEDGEMMMSLLWYYRPEHTDQGRRPDDMEDEIFASKHKDINSVACIEDKCYVLTFNEYCRYRKGVRRMEEGIKEPGLVVPQHSEYPRDNKQPPGCVASELVFFCRRVYDFRQRRILKNPG